MPTSAASAREATSNCTTSLILQRLPLKVCGFGIIQFLRDLVRECGLQRGSGLSMPASTASAREATSNCSTSLILQRLPLKVNTLTFTLKPLIVS